MAETRIIVRAADVYRTMNRIAATEMVKVGLPFPPSGYSEADRFWLDNAVLCSAVILAWPDLGVTPDVDASSFSTSPATLRQVGR